MMSCDDDFEYRLHEEDFPTGRSKHLNHPKIQHLKALIELHAEEYHNAAQKSEFRKYRGRDMICRYHIISLVEAELKEGGGHCKKQLEGDTWSINPTFDLRKRISNGFTTYIRKHSQQTFLQHEEGQVDDEREVEHDQTNYEVIARAAQHLQYIPDYQGDNETDSTSIRSLRSPLSSAPSHDDSGIFHTPEIGRSFEGRKCSRIKQAFNQLHRELESANITTLRLEDGKEPAQVSPDNSERPVSDESSTVANTSMELEWHDGEVQEEVTERVIQALADNMAEDEVQNREEPQSFKIPFKFASILFIASTIVVSALKLIPTPTNPADDGSAGSENSCCLAHEMESRLSFDDFEDGNTGDWKNGVVGDYAQGKYTSFLSISDNLTKLPYKAFHIPTGASTVFLSFDFYQLDSFGYQNDAVSRLGLVLSSTSGRSTEIDFVAFSANKTNSESFRARKSTVGGISWIILASQNPVRHRVSMDINSDMYSDNGDTLEVRVKWGLLGSAGMGLHPGIDNFLATACRDGHSALGDKNTTTSPLPSMSPTFAPVTPARAGSAELSNDARETPTMAPISNLFKSSGIITAAPTSEQQQMLVGELSSDDIDENVFGSTIGQGLRRRSLKHAIARYK